MASQMSLTEDQEYELTSEGESIIRSMNRAQQFWERPLGSFERRIVTRNEVCRGIPWAKNQARMLLKSLSNSDRESISTMISELYERGSLQKSYLKHAMEKYLSKVPISYEGLSEIHDNYNVALHMLGVEVLNQYRKIRLKNRLKCYSQVIQGKTKEPSASDNVNRLLNQAKNLGISVKDFNRKNFKSERCLIASLKQVISARLVMQRDAIQLDLMFPQSSKSMLKKEWVNNTGCIVNDKAGNLRMKRLRCISSVETELFVTSERSKLDSKDESWINQDDEALEYQTNNLDLNLNNQLNSEIEKSQIPFHCNDEVISDTEPDCEMYYSAPKADERNSETSGNLRPLAYRSSSLISVFTVTETKAKKSKSGRRKSKHLFTNDSDSGIEASRGILQVGKEMFVSQKLLWKQKLRIGSKSSSKLFGSGHLKQNVHDKCPNNISSESVKRYKIFGRFIYIRS